MNASTAGATGFGMSPNANFSHTIFELRFPASRGPVIMRLGDPVRTVVTSRKVSFASEAARMHRSSSGSGGCPLPLIDEPNVMVIDADDPPIVTTRCTKPPCGFVRPPGVTTKPPFDHCAQPRIHALDGVFDESWRCVKPTFGRYTIIYFDFVEDPASPTGAFLYITNDWIIDAANVTIPDGCYNIFHTSTGGGREQWTIKVYGDQTVWVSKNGAVVQRRTDPVNGTTAGAVGFGVSPNVDFRHTIFELRFPASRGVVTMRLGDPVRTFTRTNSFAQEAARTHASALRHGQL